MKCVFGLYDVMKDDHSLHVFENTDCCAVEWSWLSLSLLAGFDQERA